MTAHQKLQLIRHLKHAKFAYEDIIRREEELCVKFKQPKPEMNAHRTALIECRDTLTWVHAMKTEG